MAEPIKSRGGRDITVGQLHEDFIARCRAKNLSLRTIEWYGFKLGAFVDWCRDHEVFKVSQLDTGVLSDFLAAEQARGISENTLRSAAQALKTLCRFGYKRRDMPDIITGQFELPKVPEVLIPTFTDEQLQNLLAAPNLRTWIGIRDRGWRP